MVALAQTFKRNIIDIKIYELIVQNGRACAINSIRPNYNPQPFY